MWRAHFASRVSSYLDTVPRAYNCGSRYVYQPNKLSYHRGYAVTDVEKLQKYHYPELRGLSTSLH